ncbi:hypothetical protein [Janibacter corallicola]|uniref:hypothetical protein n=1 Tax=Janibacter corallicola TaxID=415212 RepID=UPI0009FBA066|nr:hypothetical protein [Janibacter corallicola]
MCRQTTCRRCGRTTWAGCGQHVDEVMRGVPSSERCPGHATPTKGSTAVRNPLARLFGRG